MTAECDRMRNKVLSVTFRNTPSFAREEDMGLKINVPTVGEVAITATGSHVYCT